MLDMLLQALPPIVRDLELLHTDGDEEIARVRELAQASHVGEQPVLLSIAFCDVRLRNPNLPKFNLRRKNYTMCQLLARPVAEIFQCVSRIRSADCNVRSEQGYIGCTMSLHMHVMTADSAVDKPGMQCGSLATEEPMQLFEIHQICDLSKPMILYCNWMPAGDSNCRAKSCFTWHLAQARPAHC